MHTFPCHVKLANRRHAGQKATIVLCVSFQRDYCVSRLRRGMQWGWCLRFGGGISLFGMWGGSSGVLSRGGMRLGLARVRGIWGWGGCLMWRWVRAMDVCLHKGMRQLYYSKITSINSGLQYPSRYCLNNIRTMSNKRWEISLSYTTIQDIQCGYKVHPRLTCPSLRCNHLAKCKS